MSGLIVLILAAAVWAMLIGCLAIIPLNRAITERRE